MGGHDLVLRRVRAHGRTRDWIPARMWLDQSLHDVLDGLPEVAPEATLLARSVRCMRAPPRRSAASGSAEVIRWRGALRAELSELARVAGRPARGAVPASAPAVLFGNAAELLSCLARDWLSGAMPDRWWWQTLCGVPGGPAHAVSETWIARSRHVPAALELLSRTGHHVAFAASLPLAAVTDVTTAVAREWAAPWLDRAAERAAALPVMSRGTALATDPPTTRAAPWRAVAPEVPAADLHPASQLLLGTGLMLARTPAVALAAPTRVAVTQWLAGRETVGLTASAETTAERREAVTRVAPPSQAPRHVGELMLSRASPEVISAAGSDAMTLAHPAPNVPAAEHPAALGSPVRSARLSSPAVRFEPESTPAARGNPVARQVADGRTIPIDSMAAEAPASVTPDLAAPPPTRSRPSMRSPQPTPPDLPPTRAPATAAAASGPQIPREFPFTAAAATPGEVHPPTTVSAAEASDVHAISTELGGIFYLLQPALIIGHYGDFSTPLQPGLALSPWDWLALVGTYLMPRAAVGDPVWGLLARLAGRSIDAPPGKGFHAPRCWRVDPRRLRALPSSNGHWSWIVSGGRLVVHHPLGFVVADVPARGDPSQQLSAELQRYGSPAVIAAARLVPSSLQPSRMLRTRLTPSVARWRVWTGGYIRAWLCGALGMDRRSAAGAFVLRRSAHVRATADRVDVTLVLDELTFAIRLAGLDLDPGWIPAAGRTVAFHYE